MSNYLKLKFTNAGLFPNKKGKGKNGKIYENGKKPEARKGRVFVEPITVYQISNMLHVLFGERPVSSVRKTFYPRIEHYFDKANDSYLKLNMSQRFNKSKEQLEPITECTQLAKADWNSWNPATQINWEIVRRFMSEDEFEWFLKEVKSVIKKDPKKLPFNKVIDLIKESAKPSFYDKLKEKSLTPIGNFIQDRSKVSEITRRKTKSCDSAILNVRGFGDIIRLSGELIVPVNDNDLEKLSECAGTAKILDGGLVWIESLVNGDEISIDGFEKVSDISTKKYKYDEN